MEPTPIVMPARATAIHSTPSFHRAGHVIELTIELTGERDRHTFRMPIDRSWLEWLNANSLDRMATLPLEIELRAKAGA